MIKVLIVNLSFHQPNLSQEQNASGITDIVVAAEFIPWGKIIIGKQSI